MEKGKKIEGGGEGCSLFESFFSLCCCCLLLESDLFSLSLAKKCPAKMALFRHHSHSNNDEKRPF